MKKIQFFVALFLFATVLNWCTKTENAETETKRVFYIETQKTSEFPKSATLKKSWKISWEKEITVNSQVIWKIKNIQSQEWDDISGWEPVVEIEDSIANYELQMELTKTSLDNAVLNYEQTKNNLEKSIEDAKINYERSQQSFETTQKTAEQTLKQAKQNLDNNTLWWNSQSQLSLEKIILDINNQIKTYKAQLWVQKSQLKNILENVLHQSDTLLWVSPKYKDTNNSIETFLWARNSKTKQDAETALLLLYKDKDEFLKLEYENIFNSQLKSQIDYISTIYPKIQNLLWLMQEVLRNSVTSSSLSQTSVDLYVATFNWLETLTTTTFSQFVWYQNQVNALLPNTANSTNDEEQIKNLAQQQIEIALKQAESQQNSAQISYDSANINIENNLFNAELNLKSSKLAYDTAKDNLNTQLKLLNNTITQAKINYQNAKTQLNKLSVRSPISWILWTFFVNEWQEVWIWQPLFIVTTNQDQEIEIFLNSEEYSHINENQSVIIKNWEFITKWKIKTINSIANQNILYKIKIKPENEEILLWEVVEVYIPIQVQKRLLPINIVGSLDSNKGFVNILKDWEPIKYDIELWKVRWDKVEINSKLPTSLEIITTDISNYDPQKFELKKSDKKTAKKSKEQEITNENNEIKNSES